MNEPPHIPKGFTLVELLAVILVIAILVAVVVGVSGRVMRKGAEEQTRLHMKVIMNAVSIYYEQYQAYPQFSGTNYTDHNTKLYRLFWNSSWGSEGSVKEKAREKATNILSSLPKEGVSGASFVDGFKQVMRYRYVGGDEPRAYLESPGADGNFDEKEDNIRSDRR